MEHTCLKCSGKTELGVATAYGLIGGATTPSDESRLVFVVPGAPTSANPVQAFKQGLANEPADAAFWIKGVRCSRCGFLELFAVDRTFVK